MERGRECIHCRQWIATDESHDCWSTTEAALTRDLHEDLQDAYDRLRESAVALGEQRIYASHHSIMFARRVCYCFVRPKHAWLEVCVFLGHQVTAPGVRRADRVSRTRVAHLLRVTHRDEVEAPLTDWLAEAYAAAGDSTLDATTPEGVQTSPRPPQDAPEARPRRASKKR